VRPCIDDTTYGYRAIDTADQRREPDSLLNWTERRIRMRRECPERSWGEYSVVRTEAPPYGHRWYRWARSTTR
jgi:maltose alpha-D-glucosyltransferase/alpha-amylase